MQDAKKTLNAYEDMPLGKIFHHHWGRTLHASDNVIFCSERVNTTRFISMQNMHAAWVIKTFRSIPCLYSMS